MKILFWKKTKSWSIGLSFLSLLSEIQLIFRMSKASGTARLMMRSIFNIGHVWEGTKAVKFPLESEERSLQFKEMSIITLLKYTDNLESVEYNYCLRSWNDLFLQKTTGALKIIFQEMTKSWSIDPSFQVLGWEIQSLCRMNMASSIVKLMKIWKNSNIFKIGNVQKLMKDAKFSSKPIKIPSSVKDMNIITLCKITKSSEYKLFLYSCNSFIFQRTTGLLKTMFSKKTKSWSIGPSFLVLAWEIQLLYRMSMASSTANLITQDMQHIFKIGNVRKLTKAANVPSKPKETP